ncbi:MAG: M16 family metallopeptidase [Planctomycetaceae bacterium]
MKDQDIQISTLDNGLVLVIEPMADVQSASFSLLVPSGSVHDPVGQNGSATVLCELLTRGAGEFDSKELSSALDNLGVQRHESVGPAHITFTGATLATNLPKALRIYGDILQRPHIPDEQFEAARLGVEQTLHALEDEPRQQIIIELRRRCFDLPWGLPSEGTLEDLDSITPDSVRAHYTRCFRPNGAIFGIAGNVDPKAIKKLVEEIFGGWKPIETPVVKTSASGPPRDHIEHDSTQTHIAIAYPEAPYRDPAYYEAWAAVSVLSGGMSSRLFTEVREKRGLCYSVHASLTSLKSDARVLCYAGTTAERAQETLDVTLREIFRLSEGIGEDELERCRARAKSSLIMQQESTLSRSSSIARDWYHLGRVTSLSEVRQRIDELSVDSILNHIRKHPPRDFTIVTIGPAPLEVTCEVS